MKVVFLGTPELSIPSLQAVQKQHDIALVVTQPDRPSGRGRHPSAPAVKREAEGLGLPLWQPEGLRDETSVAPIASAGAEIMVVVAYGLKIPDRVLGLAPEGAVNLHFSLLPALRGAAPINWAIIRGEAETGITTFRLTSRMDHGPVFLQRPVAIGAEETAGELGRRMAEAGADVLIETLSGIEAGSLPAHAQEETGASRAPKLRKADGKIDWSRPAAEIVNLVRGVNPWPGAFSRLGRKNLKVWKAEVCSLPEGFSSELPGTILQVSQRRGRIAVAAGKGVICLTEIQAEGGRRMPAGEFLAGHRMRSGSRFS